ncbi:DUF3592 domain-containing protein [Leptolyngbya sp. AN03gr2]|uniref:DUF3592 domain-containing protein n=1 Tax=unclassified Leptolyngbya TaxID=2650499 RepID=UPI003D31747C
MALSPISLIFLTLLLVIWMAFSFREIIVLLKKLVTGLLSKRWHFTEGIIVMSRILDDCGGLRTGPNYGIAFNYKYSVDDMIYHAGFEVRGFYSFALAEQELSTRYKMGQNHKIFYNPKNHREIVMTPGIKGTDVSSLFGWIVAFCMSGGWLALMIIATLLK